MVVNASLLSIATRTGADTAVWLITLGAIDEFGGVLLVASPELRDPLRWCWRTTQAAYQRSEIWLKKMLRVRRDVVIAGEPGTIRVSGHAVGVSITGVPPDVDRIDWLIERDRLNQERFQRIEDSVARLPEQWRRDIDTKGDELQKAAETLVEEHADEDIRMRLLGVACVLLGIVFSWWGNLV
jgi:hypothetical protein